MRPTDRDLLGTELDSVLEDHEHPGTVDTVRAPVSGLCEGLQGEDDLENEWGWCRNA